MAHSAHHDSNLTSPFQRFNSHTLLDKAHQGTQDDDDELESILAEVDKLQRDVLATVYDVTRQLQQQQRAALEGRCAAVQADEEKEASAPAQTKRTLRAFLAEVKSAIVGLLPSALSSGGEGAEGQLEPAPEPGEGEAADPLRAMRPLLLTDPERDGERYDVDGLKEKLDAQESEELDELDALLKSLYDLFQSLTISIFQACRSASDTFTADLNNALSTTHAREDELELERLALETFLTRVRTAFANF
ncbi:hypothetical protein JCM10207_004845 [Rhodosporidiobolus poonsookiae]